MFRIPIESCSFVFVCLNKYQSGWEYLTHIDLVYLSMFNKRIIFYRHPKLQIQHEGNI